MEILIAILASVALLLLMLFICIFIEIKEIKEDISYSEELTRGVKNDISRLEDYLNLEWKHAHYIKKNKNS